MTFNELKKDISKLTIDEMWEEIEKWQKALLWLTDRKSTLRQEIESMLMN